MEDKTIDNSGLSKFDNISPRESSNIQEKQPKNIIKHAEISSIDEDIARITQKISSIQSNGGDSTESSTTLDLLKNVSTDAASPNKISRTTSSDLNESDSEEDVDLVEISDESIAQSHIPCITRIEDQDTDKDSSFSDSKSFTKEQMDTFDPSFGRKYYYEKLGRGLQYGTYSKDNKRLLSQLNTSSSMQCVTTVTESSTSSFAGVEENDEVSSESSNGFSNSMTPPKETPIKCGWLLKQGGVVKNWKRRWFVLGRNDKGLRVSYYASETDIIPKNVISFVSTTTVSSVPEKFVSKPYAFKIVSSADASERNLVLAADSNYAMISWIAEIQAAIFESNTNVLKGSFHSLWNDAGISAFLVRYGVRKRNSRGSLQTRVIEFNFVDETIHNTRRGETQTCLPFLAIRRAYICAPESSGDGYGVQIDFNGLHRSWPIYHDTIESRDDMLSLLRHIIRKTVREHNLRRRWPHFTLKTGYLERKNVSKEDQIVGPHATLKGKFLATLHDYHLQLFPENGEITSRPWFIFSLPGLSVTIKPTKQIICLGSQMFVCDDEYQCKLWLDAIQSAAVIPKQIISNEMNIRHQIKQKYEETITKLRQMMKITIQSNKSLQEQPLVNQMLQTCWVLAFPGETWVGNNSPKWQEIGFQRGGPLSDLRSSGILGLHCFIYFIQHRKEKFQQILAQQQQNKVQDRILGYPVAIAFINLVAVLVELLGIGDAGIHSEGCFKLAPACFASLIGSEIDQPLYSTEMNHPEDNGFHLPIQEEEMNINEVMLNSSVCVFNWERAWIHNTSTVFEDINSILFSLLDKYFVDMGAGYMEFGQVLIAVRERVIEIFSLNVCSLNEFQELVKDTDTTKKRLHPTF